MLVSLKCSKSLSMKAGMMLCEMVDLGVPSRLQERVMVPGWMDDVALS